MSDDSQLPALLSNAIFHIRTSITIDAPKEKVWDILMDFPSYGEWNPYIRTQVVTDDAKKPLLAQRAEQGRHIQLTMHIPPTMDDSAKSAGAEEIITVIDDINLRFAWRYNTPARWAIYSERWQMLRVVDGKTTYETWEIFGGVLSYVIRFFIRTKLQAAFDEMARALKGRAELVD